MKAIYTDTGKREFEAFQSRQQKMLERIVAEQKSVLGDDVLEITASDIKAAAGRIRVYHPGFGRVQTTLLAIRAYIIIGIAMMGGALAYPQLLELYSAKTPQAWLFFVGAAMTFAGWLFSYWIEARQQQMVKNSENHFSTTQRQPLDAPGISENQNPG